MEQKKRTGLILGTLSLLLLGLGGLIFFEFIRPFRDGNIDIPLALGAAGLEALLSAGALILGKGAVILNVVALVLNLASLTAAFLLLHSLSHMKIM